MMILFVKELKSEIGSTSCFGGKVLGVSRMVSTTTTSFKVTQKKDPKVNFVIVDFKYVNSFHRNLLSMGMIIKKCGKISSKVQDHFTSLYFLVLLKALDTKATAAVAFFCSKEEVCETTTALIVAIHVSMHVFIINPRIHIDCLCTLFVFFIKFFLRYFMSIS
jgi:hypothetical protein